MNCFSELNMLLNLDGGEVLELSGKKVVFGKMKLYIPKMMGEIDIFC